MSSGGQGTRGRPSAGRGNHPYRGGGFRGGRANRGSRGGGPGRGRGGFKGGDGRSNHQGGPAANNDPALDSQLAPRPPHPGYFQTSFVENPWYDLESKLGVEHLKPVVPGHNTQDLHSNDADESEETSEQVTAPAEQTHATTT